VELLLGHGYGKKVDEVSAAVAETCCAGDIEAVRLLLELNVLQQSKWKYSELAVYSLFNDPFKESPVFIQIFELLIAHGLNVSAAKLDSTEGVFVNLCRSVQVESLYAVL
jgi:hypothetical protein